MAIIDTLKGFVQAPIAKVVAIIAVVAIVVAVVFRFHLFGRLWTSPWRLEILIGIAAILIFAVVFWVIPWFREWRFMREYDATSRADGGASPQEFRAKFVDAARRLRQLPQLAHSREPLMALPWYLMLGASQSGKTAALASSGVFSPHTQLPSEGGTQNCDWWVSNALVALDTPGRYALPTDPARDRGEWYRLLRLIKHYRAAEPLNGIVVTVSADQLACDSGEKLRSEGGSIRERIEEAIRELGVNFPIYMLVTKCDLVEGFSEFFGAMPERTYGDAVGYVEEQLSANRDPLSVEPLQRLQTGLRAASQRLHLMRLGLLNAKMSEALREPIFCFPEEVRLLEQPLRAFAAPLVSQDVAFHTPVFRGVFFASARQQGVPLSLMRRQLGVAIGSAPPEAKKQQAYFLRDLFTTILPRDRALASASSSNAKSRDLTV